MVILEKCACPRSSGERNRGKALHITLQRLSIRASCQLPNVGMRLWPLSTLPGQRNRSGARRSRALRALLWRANQRTDIAARGQNPKRRASWVVVSQRQRHVYRHERLQPAGFFKTSDRYSIWDVKVLLANAELCDQAFPSASQCDRANLCWSTIWAVSDLA